MSKAIRVLVAILMYSAPAWAHLPIDPPLDQIAAHADDCKPAEVVRDLRIDLVVDDSISMAGFVRIRGGDYRRVLSAITDLRVVPRVTIRSLNRPIVPISSPVVLYTEKFYRFRTTPLQNALDRIPRDPANMVTVLVSDLLQSKRGEDPRNVTRALARALNCAPYAMVIGFSAPFYEDARICSPNCRPDPQRHFYVIAMAHDLRYLRKFVSTTKVDALADHRSVQDIRNGDGEGPTLFYSMAPVLSASRIEVVAPQQEDWSVVDRENTMVDCHAGLFQTPFVAFATPRAAKTPTLFARINARVNATVDDVKVLADDVQQTRVPGPVTAIKAVDPKRRIVNPRHFTPLVGTGRTRWFELRLDGDIPNSNQWRIYRVRMKVPADSVHPPWWVERWMAEWTTGWKAQDPPPDETLALEGIVNEIIQGPETKALLTEFWIGLTYEQLK